MISVLLPYRNAGSTLAEAVDSVLAQRGVALELLAIDDGSRDDGPAQLARLAARHHNLLLLSTGGTGLVGALALGLRGARARLIARMDGDDVCHPERLARQLDALAADARLAAVGTQVEAFPAAAVGAGLARYVAWQNALTTPADHARELFIESPLCHPSVLLRREALATVGGWRPVAGPEDYDLWLRLDAHGFALAKVPQVLLRWRHRPDRATFADPRYAPARFRELKAPHLARRLRALARPVTVWGAGPTGKRLARALEPHGVSAHRFVDIDPKKIGRRARGAPIVAPDALVPGAETVVVAVGALGARALIRARLDALGFSEGEGYLLAA
ncbi:MAG TPA: glycosyltransferase [Polyangia bacterium]|nr:glycosyltransferase [Polyangia bacterium]